MAAGREVMRGAGTGDGGGAGQQTGTGDGLQALHGGVGSGQGCNLIFDLGDVVFEGVDFFEQAVEDLDEWVWEVGVVEDVAGLSLGDFGAFGYGMAELTQEAAQAIDALGSGAFPLLTDAVELLNLLLVDRAHGHGLDAFTAMGFEDGLGVDAVGLAAASIGFDVMGGDELGLMATRGRLTGPIVCGAAGFDQEQRRLLSMKEFGELGSREAVTLENATAVVGDGDFENIFCQVGGDDFRLHGWTPPDAG